MSPIRHNDADATQAPGAGPVTVPGPDATQVGDDVPGNQVAALTRESGCGAYDPSTDRMDRLEGLIEGLVRDVARNRLENGQLQQVPYLSNSSTTARAHLPVPGCSSAAREGQLSQLSHGHQSGHAAAVRVYSAPASAVSAHARFGAATAAAVCAVARLRAEDPVVEGHEASDQEFLRQGDVRRPQGGL
ncbi:hypothetical protein ON010_g15715 [Phytophthora cinnamomi]|nr:hypothetical protein ON010_g15715 [Phytophthora cinnamomi]